MLIVVKGPPTVALSAAHQRGITKAAFVRYWHEDATDTSVVVLHVTDDQMASISEWYCEEADTVPPPDGTCLFYAREERIA